MSTVSRQPDPLASHDAPNAHLWLGRFIVWGAMLVSAASAVGIYKHYEHRRQRRRWWAFWR